MKHFMIYVNFMLLVVVALCTLLAFDTWRKTVKTEFIESNFSLDTRAKLLEAFLYFTLTLFTQQNDDDDDSMMNSKLRIPRGKKTLFSLPASTTNDP